MKIVLSLLVFVLIPLTVHSSKPTCSKDAREKDAQCGTYCLQVVKPLLNYASSVRAKEDQFAKLQTKISEQKAQLTNQIELTASCQRNIASKDAFIANLQSQIKSKESQIGEKDKQISSLQSQQKDYELNIVKTNQLESRLAECKDMCLASSCLRKLTDIYMIKVPDIEPFSVHCDSNLAGNGWTVFQRRMDGSEDFYRTWDEYKAGFGDLRSEFFLGLEKLHLLTKSQPHELYIHPEDFESETRYAKYTHFVIGNEEEAYEIKKLGDYSGDAGDAMVKHLDMKFTTKDRDNDVADEGNCAALQNSGWWFKNCSACNLNGRYTSKDVDLYGLKISWNHWHSKPLKFTQMMIRPKST